MTKIKIDNKPLGKKIANELEQFSNLMQRIFFNRGIHTKKDAEEFIAPDWERDTYDPFLIEGMEKAVNRIILAIENKQKIVVYGDYDCDGIPGSTVLHDFFKKIGFTNFSNYIPHRHNEGYGLQLNAVKQFVKEKVDIIITVDVGITDIESVTLAQENNIDVIVTDHHLPIKEKGEEKLPSAYAILNSKQESDSYPDDMLCGAGVAFKLVQALLIKGKENNKFSEVLDGWEKWLLDMVGIATIADMVPLVKENRALAYYGLQVIKKNKRLGLKRLLESIRINPTHITEDDIGFMIAPRINAASRMDHPVIAFDMLSSDDGAVVEERVNFLEKLNDKRKIHVASMIKSARKRLEGRQLNDVIVIGDTGWLPGVLGLAASKFVDEYRRPVFVWGHDKDGIIKGSCRTDGSVSLVELMRIAPDETFVQFGGHDGAGGFTVTRDSIHTLEEVLSAEYNKIKKETEQKIIVDTVMSLDDVSWDMYNSIEKLAPFGASNKKPIFLFENITIDNFRLFGKGKNHLGIDFKNSRGIKISSIGFFMTDKSFPHVTIASGEKINLVATLEKSFFRYQKELRLRIVTIEKA